MDRLLKFFFLAVLAACAPAPTGGRPRSVAELAAVLESGHLPARRAAIVELAAAAPVTPAELEFLSSAALQIRRVRLRRAALAAIGNAQGPNPRLLPGALRLADASDSAAGRAGLDLCLRLGLSPDDPRLAFARRMIPSAFPDDPATELARRKYRAKADRAELVLASLKPGEIQAAFQEAERLRLTRDAAAMLALLDRPAFRAGGFEAGRYTAMLGAAAVPRALELACSGELMDHDAGLGTIFHMKDPAGYDEIRRRAKGKDNTASCAQTVMSELGIKP